MSSAPSCSSSSSSDSCHSASSKRSHSPGRSNRRHHVPRTRPEQYSSPLRNRSPPHDLSPARRRSPRHDRSLTMRESPPRSRFPSCGRSQPRVNQPRLVRSPLHGSYPEHNQNSPHTDSAARSRSLHLGRPSQRTRSPARNNLASGDASRPLSLSPMRTRSPPRDFPPHSGSLIRKRSSCHDKPSSNSLQEHHNAAHRSNRKSKSAAPTGPPSSLQNFFPLDSQHAEHARSQQSRKYDHRSLRPESTVGDKQASISSPRKNSRSSKCGAKSREDIGCSPRVPRKPSSYFQSVTPANPNHHQSSFRNTLDSGSRSPEQEVLRNGYAGSHRDSADLKPEIYNSLAFSSSIRKSDVKKRKIEDLEHENRGQKGTREALPRSRYHSPAEKKKPSLEADTEGERHPKRARSSTTPSDREPESKPSVALSTIRVEESNDTGREDRSDPCSEGVVVDCESKYTKPRISSAKSKSQTDDDAICRSNLDKGCEKASNSSKKASDEITGLEDSPPSSTETDEIHSNAVKKKLTAIPSASGDVENKRNFRSGERKLQDGVKVDDICLSGAEGAPQLQKSEEGNEKKITRSHSESRELEWDAVRLFVGSLPLLTTEKSVQELFCKFGPVNDVFLKRHFDTGALKGFGFVTMESKEGFENVMKNRDAIFIDGSPLRVEAAKPRERSQHRSATQHDERVRFLPKKSWCESRGYIYAPPRGGYCGESSGRGYGFGGGSAIAQGQPGGQRGGYGYLRRDNYGSRNPRHNYRFQYRGSNRFGIPRDLDAPQNRMGIPGGSITGYHSQNNHHLQSPMHGNRNPYQDG